ncbi:hypothetical protein MHEC_20850 [Mycobacterium heckeshornense]|uniref:Uncharacterized protein n=1 Tax=Mycobacterium heckeshornense TaxID=110505 RepID=A0A7R7GTH0_9MYCO|nr:hypothetical protein MHEC_20850 [Mycobacterium heckeshornense]
MDTYDDSGVLDHQRLREQPMTTPADDPIAQQRFAFRMKPQFEHTTDGWRAWYPGSDWSVTAPSAEEARQKLVAEVNRRREAGEDPKAFQEAVYRKHLQEPVPGVYAMDNELYRYVARETGYDQDALQEVFEESERRRALGESFTKADYLAWMNRKN